jgi:hypothetical protein
MQLWHRDFVGIGRFRPTSGLDDRHLRIYGPRGDPGLQLGSWDRFQRELGLPRPRKARQDLFREPVVRPVDGDQPVRLVVPERDFGLAPGGPAPFRADLLRFGEQSAHLKGPLVGDGVDPITDPVEGRRRSIRGVDQTHRSEPTEIEVLGHVLCECGAWVAQAIADRTGGSCPKCFAAGLSAKTKVIEVRSYGRTIGMPAIRPKSVAKRAKNVRATRKREQARPELRQRNQTSIAASRSAMKRLRNIFRDIYEILLAEERAKLGLDPFPAARLAMPVDREVAEKCLDWATVYDALDHHGVAE